MVEKRKKTESKIENKKVKDSEKSEPKEVVGTEKRIGTRGRVFEGIVTKKFPKRVTINFERMIYIRKYERYAKSKTKIHARLPENMEKEIKIGDLIQVQECRPLSKIIHFMVIKKIKDKEDIK